VRTVGTRIKMGGGGEGVAAGEGVRRDWRVSKKHGAAVWAMVKKGEGRIRGKKVQGKRGQRKEEEACRERDKDRTKWGTGAGAKRKEVGSEGVLKKWGQRSLGTRKERDIQD
jgi:hypothetical protein